MDSDDSKAVIKKIMDDNHSVAKFHINTYRTPQVWHGNSVYVFWYDVLIINVML